MDERSYPADLYAAVHTGTPGDLAFYQRVTDGAASVLELGCGAGRVLAALDAPVLVGVDRHPGLLAMARTRMGGECVLIEADVTTLALNAGFAVVIAPFSTLYAFTSDALLRAAVRVAHAHLEDNGLFAFDVWYADAFHAEADPAEQADFEEVGEVEVGGVRYVVEERSDWDRDAQTLVVDYRHTPDDGAPPRLGRIVHRYVLEDDLVALVEETGFTIIDRGLIDTEAGESLAIVAARR
jgi:SAM-dependent methyltransferase